MSDCDGLTSSSIIYNFIRKHLKYDNIQVFFHKGKQHGLAHNEDEDIVQDCIDNHIQLLVVPDAGSNNNSEFGKLRANGCLGLVLDHHEVTQNNIYPVVVNHHLGNNLNIALSGCGVTFKFIQVYCKYYNMKIPDYSDVVAVSLVSDVCDLSTLENRLFIHRGLGKKPKNEMLKLMFEKLAKGKEITPDVLSWNIIPPINALCRGCSQEDKETFFMALAGFGDVNEGLKVARKAHRTQKAESKRIAEEIESNIDNSHKIIVAFGDKEDKNYLGLACNKIVGEYNKPTFVFREVDDEHYSGSMRSPVELASKINESGIAKCQGHEMACGVFIEKSNLESFLNWADKLDLEIVPSVPVAGIIDISNVNIDFCKLISKYNILWGKGMEAPKFYFNFKVKPDDIYVYKGRTTTLRIDTQNVKFIKFFASEKEAEDFENACRIKGKINVEIVGGLEVNEYNGFENCQCIIDKYEFKEESWEDLW